MMKELSDKEVLQAAIEKAIEGGWKNPQRQDLLTKYFINFGDDYYRLEEIIFSHEFCKALWGETADYIMMNMPYPDMPPQAYLYQNGYRYHVQQIATNAYLLTVSVLAEDRIDYLWRNI